MYKKRIISSLLFLFFLLSQFQVGIIYAASQQGLQQEKEKQTQVLEKVETVIDTAIDKIDDKIKDEDRSERLREKQEEIEEYLEEVQQEIEDENSTRDIKEKVQEAKKVVVLKVVSGVTEYEDVEESISSDVADTPKEKAQALEVIQDSLETASGDYSIIVRSKSKYSAVKKLFSKFDTKIQINTLYEQDEKYYYEVFIDKDSIFRQEMLEDIERGILPENFVGIEIVMPEVFGIGNDPHPPRTSGTSPLQEEESGMVVDGENLSSTWGIEKYQTYTYFNKISELSSVTVGVVDTGIDYNHPDLKGAVQGKGYDFVNDDADAWDDQGHGTHVAGTIAAQNNGTGIVGVNPYAKLIPLKICDKRGFCPSYAVLRALEYAKDNKIQILNMSLGGRATVKDHPICAGIASYTESGGIVIAASGNSNIDTSRFVPGGCEKSITVGAVDNNLKRAVFSNYGSKVDVAAPGVKVYSSYPNGQYKSLSGTSMATPHIVGLASILKAQKSSLNASQMKQQLKAYTQDVNTESSKYLAKFSDAEKIVGKIFADLTPASSLATPSPSEERGEENISQTEQTDVSSDTSVKDEAILSPDLVFVGEPEEQQEEYISQETGPSIQQVQIGAENVEINSEETINILSETIIPLLEDEKDIVASDVAAIQSFGDEAVAINSVEEESEDEEEVFEPVVLSIDGGQAPVQINSADVEEDLGEEIFFEEFSQNPEITPEIITELPQEEAGDATNSEAPLQEGEPVEVFQETLEYQDHQEEYFIEDPDAPVEINSDTELPSGEIPVFENLEDTSTEQGFEELDENNLPDEPLPDSEEAIEAEDVFIDGAEAQIEINSAQEPVFTPVEVLEVSPDELDTEQNIPALIYGENGEEIHPDDLDEAFESVEVNEAAEDSAGEIVAEEITLDDIPGNQGVEINNISDEDEAEVELEIPEVSAPPQDENLFDQDAGEIILDFIPPEETTYGYGISDPSEDVGEEEIVEIEGQSLENLDETESGNIGIQNSYFCEAYTGQRCAIRFYKGYRYSHYYSDRSAFQVSASRRYMYITPKKLGNHTLKMYYRGRYAATIYITGKETPKPVTKDITLEKGQRTFVYLPNAKYLHYSRSGDYNSYFTGFKSFGFYLYTRGTGKSSYYVRDRSGLHVATLNINVLPKVEKYTIQEGRQFSLYQRYAYRYQYEFTKNIARVSASSRYMSLNGTAGGNTRLYVKKSGKLERIIDLTIVPKPKPQTYTLKISEGSYSDIHLKSSLSYYRLQQISGTGGYARISNYGNKLRIWGYGTGKVQYRIVDRYSQHLYTIQLEVIPKVQVYNHSTFAGKRLLLRFRSSNSEKKISSSNLKTTYDRRHYRYVTSSVAGYYEVKEYLSGYHVRTHKITVKALPKVKEYSINVVENKETSLHLPIPYNRYRFYVEYPNQGRASIYGYSGYIKVRGNTTGQMKLKVHDTMHGLHYYTVNINIIPEPPKVYNYSTYEGRKLYFRLNGANTYQYTTKNGNNVSLATSWHYLYITANKAGVEEIYVKKNGIHRYTIRVNVIAPPKPKVYEVNLKVGQRATLNMPEDYQRYRYKYSGTWVYEKIRQYSNSMYIDTRNAGNSEIHFYDSRTGFTKYLVKVNVSLYEKHITVYQTEYKRQQVSSRYNVDSKNRSIATSTYERFGKSKKYRHYIYGANVGTTTFDVKKDYHTYQRWYVTVLPAPEPEVIECKTTVGKDCRFYYKNSGVTQKLSRPGIITVDEIDDKRVKVEAEGSGVAEFHLRHPYANYTKYILKMTISPAQVHVDEVETPISVPVETNWWYGSKEGFTFGVSKNNMVDLSREWGERPRNSGDKVKLKITPKQQGKVDIYIYRFGDLFGVVKMNILPKISKISVEDFYFKVKEGQRITTKVLSGGGKYREGPYDKTGLYFDVDSSKQDDGTGEVEITGKKAGKYDIYIEDRWGQTKSLRVWVKPAKLEISGHPLAIKPGQAVYVHVFDVIRGIAKIEKNNNNIRVYKKTVSDTYDTLVVTGVYGGETTLAVTDGAGKTVSTKVMVSGSKTPPRSVEEEKKEETKSSVEKGEKIEVQNLKYDYIEELGIGYGVFKVKGEYTNIGLQYLNQNNEIRYLELEPQGDNTYAFVVDEELGGEMKKLLDNFVVYMIDSNENIVTSHADKYLSFTSQEGVSLTSYDGVKINTKKSYFDSVKKFNNLKSEYLNTPLVVGRYDALLALIEVYKEDIIGDSGNSIIGEINTILKNKGNAFKLPQPLLSMYNRAKDNAYLSNDSDYDKTVIIGYMQYFSYIYYSSASKFTHKQKFYNHIEKHLGGILYHYGYMIGVDNAVTDTKQFIDDVKDELPQAAKTTAISLKDTYMSFAYYTTCNLFKQEYVCNNSKRKKYDKAAYENIIAIGNAFQFGGDVIAGTTAEKLYELTGKQEYKEASEMLGSKVSESVGPLLEETEQLYNDFREVQKNFDKLDDRDYWEGVLSGYMSVITTELTAVGGSAKILKDKSGLLKSSVGGILYSGKEMLAKFRYAVSLGNGVKFDTIFNGSDTGWKNNKEGFIKNPFVGGLASKLKPIKSFDLHIFEKHGYGGKIEGSKFLKGADIKAIVKEGYKKKNKRVKETVSKNDITNKEIPSIAIEIDMGRTIGTNKNYNGEYTKLSIIVDYEGNVISAYPIANFRIK